VAEGSDIVKAGWLMKKGGGSSVMSRRNWKRRYCVLLKTNEMKWFDGAVSDAAASVREPSGSVVFAGKGMKVITDYPSKYNFAWKISGASDNDRTYEFRAELHSELQDWIKVLKESVEISDAISERSNVPDSDKNMV
jgi:myosin X